MTPDDVAAALLAFLPPLPPWAAALWAVPNMRLAFGCLVAAAVLWVVLAPPGKQSTAASRPAMDAAFDGALAMGLGLWRGAWWRFRPTIAKRHLWQVGAYRISTKRKHAGIVGATGSRKSTLAVPLVRGDRPTLVLTGEPSDPLRAAVYALMKKGKALYWSPNGDLGWDMLQGDPMETAERLTAGTKKNEQDTGLGRGIVQDAIYHVFTAADERGVPRSWELVDAALEHVEHKARVERDQNGLGAAQRWRQRFNHARLALGDALGDELDIEQAMRDGMTVMMEMSSMRSPESTPWTAANILLDGKRAANRVRGGRLIVDEGWAFKERKAEVAELVRAGRRLGWEVYFLTQLPQDYEDEMLGNMRTWVFLMQVGANTAALEWCSRAVHRKLPPEAFSEGVLKEGEGWLMTGGRVVRIKVPVIKVHNVPETLPNPLKGLKRGWRTGGEEKNQPGAVRVREENDPGPASGTVVEPGALPGRNGNGAYALQSGQKVVPSWIKSSERRSQIWNRLRGTWTAEACHLWPEDAGRNKGYGKTSYLNVSGWETHFLFWAWKVIEDWQLHRHGDLLAFYARHPEVPPFQWNDDEDEQITLRRMKVWMRTWMIAVVGKHEKNLELSIDHACPGFPNTLCGNWIHLHLVTAGENSKLRHSRRTGKGRLEAEAAHA